MNITIEQLRFAVRECTPGAPDSYANRLWQALEQVCQCDAGGNVPHEPHLRRGYPADATERSQSWQNG